jgi:hypothetical protein
VFNLRRWKQSEEAMDTSLICILTMKEFPVCAGLVVQERVISAASVWCSKRVINAQWVAQGAKMERAVLRGKTLQ